MKKVTERLTTSPQYIIRYGIYRFYEKEDRTSQRNWKCHQEHDDGKGVTEIDLTLDEENYDAGWVIRRVENASELEEVQVAYIMLDGNNLFYKDESAWEIDEEWIPFDVTDNILAGCIDSVYDAIYQRIW